MKAVLPPGFTDGYNHLSHKKINKLQNIWKKALEKEPIKSTENWMDVIPSPDESPPASIKTEHENELANFAKNVKNCFLIFYASNYFNFSMRKENGKGTFGSKESHTFEETIRLRNNSKIKRK